MTTFEVGVAAIVAGRAGDCESDQESGEDPERTKSISQRDFADDSIACKSPKNIWVYSRAFDAEERMDLNNRKSKPRKARCLR